MFEIFTAENESEMSSRREMWLCVNSYISILRGKTYITHLKNDTK